MRILSLLIKILLTGGVVAVVSFFIGREVLLQLATRQMVTELRELQKASQTKNSYHRSCQIPNAVDGTRATVQSVELAFLNSTEYQIQLVCSNFSYQPVVLRSGSLPRFVEKMPGSAGFVWSDETPTSISLGVWGRFATITLAQSDIKVRNQGQEQAVSTSSLNPLTQCSGYGFSCCQEGSQLGAGEQAPNVRDCPRTCFSQCLTRPVILTFNTQPFYDARTRTLKIQSGESVTFSYVSELIGASTPQVALDLGDGQLLTSTNLQDSLTHTYTCTQAVCRYQARLSLTNAAGITNVDSNLNHVTIIVTAE